MSYSVLAPFYQCLEQVSFGRALQAARCACLKEPAPDRALVLGEGDGRFLEQAVQAWPETQFTVIEQSSGMLRLAQKRTARDRVRFLQGSALDLKTLIDAPNEGFDAVISHFFLDCFTIDTLHRLVPMVLERVVPRARWYVSEFRNEHWWQRCLLWGMYRFFHHLTETEATCFPLYEDVFRTHELARRRLATWRAGFVAAEVWESQA